MTSPASHPSSPVAQSSISVPVPNGRGSNGPTTLAVPRRRFGAASPTTSTKPVRPNDARPSSSTSSSSSIRAATPLPNALAQGLLTPPDDGFRQDVAALDHRRSSSFTAEGVNKAQSWLSGWAPRGEGRGRAFVNNTLHGVAGVASQVGQEINGAFGNFGVHYGSPTPSPAPPTSTSTFPGSQSHSPSPPLPPPPASSSDFETSHEMNRAVSPPGPTHTSSTPSIPTTKRILQPSNISRLGPSSPPIPDGLTMRPSMSNPSTSTNLPSIHNPQPHAVHGPSHLNPHLRAGTESVGPHAGLRAHARSPSFGNGSNAVASGSIGGLTRSDSQATGGLSMTGKGAGMPYKIGFQPAGVRSDQTEQFLAERKRMGEEVEKVEGRLGRRWAKVGRGFFTRPMGTGTDPALMPDCRTSLQPKCLTP